MEAILPSVTNIDMNRLEEFAPSELKQLWEAFREVNGDFFVVIQKLKIEEIITDSLRKSLTDVFADLSAQATA